MMERFYNVMVESFGTGERRKPLGSANPFESYLDCERSTGFTPYDTHTKGSWLAYRLTESITFRDTIKL